MPGNTLYHSYKTILIQNVNIIAQLVRNKMHIANMRSVQVVDYNVYQFGYQVAHYSFN